MKIILFLIMPIILFSQNFGSFGSFNKFNSKKYIVNTGFEEGTAPLGFTTSSGTVNYNYTGIVLNGTQSMYCNGVSPDALTELTFASQNYIYGYVILRTSQVAVNQHTLDFFSGATAVGAIWLYPNKIRILTFGNNAYGTYIFSVNTKYYLKYYWKKGTGANAILKVWVSTTGIFSDTPDVNITNGTVILPINKIKFYGDASNVVYDDVKVSNWDFKK